MRSLTAAIIPALTLVALAAQAPPIRPGLYAITAQMEMPNMPMKMPEMKMEQCITAEDLKRDAADWLPRNPGQKDACKVTDQKVDGNTYSWKMACTGEQSMSGSGELTVQGDGYTGVMKMTTAQGEMTMKMSGKRLRDCK